jgi:hypothetical protein
MVKFRYLIGVPVLIICWFSIAAGWYLIFAGKLSFIESGFVGIGTGVIFFLTLIWSGILEKIEENW